MKGFIEVTDAQSDNKVKVLINVNQIRGVRHRRIAYSTQSAIECEESYEEIKALIEESSI